MARTMNPSRCNRAPLTVAMSAEQIDNPQISLEPNPHQRNMRMYARHENKPTQSRHSMAKLLKSCAESAPKPAVITNRNVLNKHTSKPAASNATLEAEYLVRVIGNSDSPPMPQSLYSQPQLRSQSNQKWRHFRLYRKGLDLSAEAPGCIH